MTPVAYANQHRQQFLNDLIEFVRFPSVSAQPAHRADLRNCVHWLRDHLRGIGLTVRVHATPGHPILVARTPRVTGPTVLVYGHYDVQPPEPLNLWRTPPFTPTVRAGKLFGRGASDNKGQVFCHIKAVECYRATKTPLPVNLVFLIEGEEEIGSGSLPAFLNQQAKELRADYVVISDTGMWAPGIPAVTYGTRGVVGFEIRVHGPDRDLHSGVFGGSIANPALVLAQLLATCVDETGRITIDGFDEDVERLTAWERREFARLPFNERAYARSLGVPMPHGEPGYSTTERRWARPTFEVNGLFGGYQGDGHKTIVPAWAGAKVTCRLVPRQQPSIIVRRVRDHLRRHCPPTVRLRVTSEHGAPAFLQSPDSPGIAAAATALKSAFGRAPVLIREGGSLPILPVLQKKLGAEILLVGLGLPDDNWHSPNEKFNLENFRRGIRMSLELFRQLGATGSPAKE